MLLFSLSVVVSVWRVTFSLKRMKGAGAFQMSAPFMLCFFFNFLRTVGRIWKFFLPKTICNPRGIIPQNFSLLGLAVLEELGNKQINTQTH